MKIVLNIKEKDKLKHFLSFIKEIDFIEIENEYNKKNDFNYKEEILNLINYNRQKKIKISNEIDINHLIDGVNL